MTDPDEREEAPLTHGTDARDEAVACLTGTAPILLVLDFDGVLSELVDDPHAAQLLDGMEDALLGVAARDGIQLVLSSGRGLSDLAVRVPQALLDAGVGLVGGHGTEADLPGDVAVDALFDARAATATLDGLQPQVEDALADAGDGWWVERKTSSLAVHSRRVTGPTDAHLAAVRDLFDAHADDPPGWTVLAGKDVLELRPAGTDKGRALDWLRGLYPDHTPFVFGDDVTDEDAFAASLAADGGALLVCDHDRPTHAPARIDSPAEVLDLLQRVAAA